MPDTAAEVEQFVYEYAEEFSTADPAVIASHFHEPATLVGPDGVRVLETRDGVERLFTAILEGLHERDYGSSEAAGMEVDVLGPDRARATVEWVRYTTGGEELERLTTTHVFRRTDDGWKMVVLAPHEQ
jgi:uncharacterized protein (TIGR02246 family)